MSLASYHCSTPGRESLGRRCRGGSRRLLAATVALEYSGRRKLAELVADHVFRHVQLQELPPVVNQERDADEFWHHRAIARPRLDRFALAVALHFGQQPLIDVRPFFQRTAHLVVPDTDLLFYETGFPRPRHGCYLGA